ncbi:RNA-binding protein [Methylococcus sp. EFPC2]|nr:RNA-binding protein [Methylococcus sp. EFPC2]
MVRRGEQWDAAHDERMRLDKWLWAARFFKTRQLATDAINGGKVHVNGQRVKPGKEISVGARLEISKDSLLWDVTVTALNKQRRPALEAGLLYEEHAESKTRRDDEVARRRAESSLHTQPDRRPDKKGRRAIHRFKREAVGE